jgi:hypothetical protein
METMRTNKTGWWFIRFLCCLAVSTVIGQEKPTYMGTLDYIQKTGRLWGVKELLLNTNGTVTFVDAKNSGYGHGLTMFDSKDKAVDQVVLSPSQSCSLSDGRHAFIKYELSANKDGVVTVVVTDRFDARSFGKNVTAVTKTVQIKPYKDGAEGPQQRAGGGAANHPP